MKICKSLQFLNISNWKFQHNKPLYVFGMFYNCNSLNMIILSNCTERDTDIIIEELNKIDTYEYINIDYPEGYNKQNLNDKREN